MKTLALHILDILENSVAAKASKIEIELTESDKNNLFLIRISDNGKGMSPEMLATVSDPYTTSRTTRKVGLGIPLFKQNAEQTGGSFEIDSELGKGTNLNANFIKDNIDRPPLGDIGGSIVLSASSYTDIRFVYSHKTDIGEYVFDTDEIKEALDGLPLNTPQVIKYLKEMITENLDEIGAEK